ncbi:glycine betaine/L-proline transporter ProP [Amycolatopsis ultiminotia]|uniref:Glycine betaine/L-proline transporter ProP n=1 Tax=Amycolatopsis ultiminotia TaxID=543629 RepID=A0ABP6YE73_9PSEU
MTVHAPVSPSGLAATQRRKAITAACIGNFIEYYDFVVYGYFASVIAKLFFPSGDTAASLLLTFAAFAVSYAARPLGAVIFSHLGDKHGRRTPLAVSVILIAVSTTVIGLLPTYDAIGIAAPIILTGARMVQGIAVGGEYGGATSFIAEYANRRRGYYTGWQTFTIGLALFTGGAIATVLTASLSEQALSAWGWRLPFLVGVPLGLIGLYLRMRLDETPHFLAAKENTEVVRAPVMAGIRRQWRSLLIGMGVVVTPAICIYVLFVYTPTYLGQVVGHSRFEAQAANLAGLAFYCVLIPLFARLSDRIGRKPLMIAGTVALVVLAYPAFLMLGSAHVAVVVSGLCLLGLAFAPHSAVMLAVVAELFPTTVRYTGLSLSLNIPVTLLGGTAPLIATFLISRSENTAAPAFFVMAGAIVSLVAALAARETAHSDLIAA